MRVSLGSFFWFLLVAAALPQALAEIHNGVAYLTAVGREGGPFTLMVVVRLDGQQVLYYDSTRRELVLKLGWLYRALGARRIREKQQKLKAYEEDFRWAVENWMSKHNESGGTHIVQVLVGCEMDGDTQVGSSFKFAYNGMDFCWLDELQGGWVAASPAVLRFEPFQQESTFWSKGVRSYVKEECVTLMRHALRYWQLRELSPPEVTVTRKDAPDGSLTLSCLATGFYPSSILLRWVKDGEKGLWGEESSSGTLPNADDTFYLRQTLELRAEVGDSSYVCLVEHSTLGVPTAYPAPRKPTWWIPWSLALGVAAAAGLVLSPAVGFILWRKKKQGLQVQDLTAEREMIPMNQPEVLLLELTNPGAFPHTEAGAAQSPQEGDRSSH
ncbi:class I histocompatibility antigen, F10 alpha chain-like [Ornithorhynchus anatinus]|uniref:class I histocompatibility antigen, F10 alpha chain-like n=1 Tax=Ornithorhynchus anatinus TaxID=9258 RepID=UPI0010A81B6E|nr:class I histocompatibility antigen, F10 alpha chain-like [Ornithorhynchus anatinus]